MGSVIKKRRKRMSKKKHLATSASSLQARLKRRLNKIPYVFLRYAGFLHIAKK